MVIYDGQTGQGCHVIFCLMESNKCVCMCVCVVRGELACVCVAGKEINFWGTSVILSEVCFIFSYLGYYFCWRGLSWSVLSDLGCGDFILKMCFIMHYA